MTGSEHLQKCSSCGASPVCSGQYLSNVVRERNSESNSVRQLVIMLCLIGIMDFIITFYGLVVYNVINLNF